MSNTANFSTNTSVNTPISGLGAGDTLNKVEIVWMMLGTDYYDPNDLLDASNLAGSAAFAIANGRSTTLTAGVNDAAIAAFQTTAGTTVTIATPINGDTYTPAVRVTENKAGGGTQSGPWTKGPAVTYSTGTTTTSTTAAATTTTTAAATTTTTAAATTTTTTAAPGSVSMTFDGSGAPGGVITITTVGGGTGALDTNGSLKLSTSTATDGALAYDSTIRAKTDVQSYRVRFKVVSTADIVMSGPNGLNVLAMKNDAGSPGLPGTFGYQLIPQVVVASGALGFDITYYNAAGSAICWDAAANTWVPDTPVHQGLVVDTWYWLELTTDATGFTYALYAAGTATSKGAVIKTAPKVNWSNAYVYSSGNLRIQLGGDYTTDGLLKGTIYFDTYQVG